jgi:hypothetical protein
MYTEDYRRLIPNRCRSRAYLVGHAVGHYVAYISSLRVLAALYVYEACSFDLPGDVLAVYEPFHEALERVLL